MIRATLDVNVLASGLLAEAGIPAELIDRWTDLAFALVASEHLLEGLARTWRKPYYQRRLDPERVRQAFALLRAQATLVAPVETVRGVAPNEEDDLVLATALAGGATFLVTGDKPFRGLGRYQDVVLLSPREFLAVLDSEAAP